MRIAGALAVLTMLLLSSPLPADEIPTRVQADESRVDRQKVTERLSELGMAESSALVHAAQLTDAVAAHYANSPVTLQIVAGLHTDEVLFGTLYLIIIGAALNRLDQRPEDS